MFFYSLCYLKVRLDNFIKNSKYHKLYDKYMDLIYHFLLQRFTVFTDFLKSYFQLGMDGWGQFDIYWIAFYKFFEYLGVKYDKCDLEILNDAYELSKSCMWYFSYMNYCIIIDRPIRLNFEFSSTELNHYEKPVIQFRGENIYYIQGIEVESRLVENPMSITIKEIEEENNLELRRIKIQVYDYYRKQGSYIKDSGAELIDSCDLGKLFKKPWHDDESIVMVQVKNCTINSDGSIDEYFIRVPPFITKVKEAIAWTFNMEENKYNPIIES